MSNADRITLDTLGKLHAHRHGLFGYCRTCDRHFDVPLPALIAARGADSPVVRMRPVRCAAAAAERQRSASRRRQGAAREIRPASEGNGYSITSLATASDLRFSRVRGRRRPYVLWR